VRIEADGRTVEITHPERVLFPDPGLTKADLAEYHLAVAPVLVPHLRDRPLMLQRFPEGIDADGFYQKEAGRGVPSWLRTVRVDKVGGEVAHPVVDDTASLLALTNLSTVSFHRWTSRADRLDHPDLMVVDLDPSGDDFEAVRRAAHRTLGLFDELDLAAYLQVTGSRGIHVVVPLDRSAATDAVAAFAQGVAAVLAARHPDELTVEPRKRDRRGRLYVIIGRSTFSAAQNLSTLIERHTEAIFVGEPTGSSPTFVGETIDFQLPYSGVWANVSDLLWQSGWPMDERTWIAPLLYTPPTFAAFRENRDPALEAILAVREQAPGSAITRWD